MFLEGKKAIVTGGARGIGRAIALALAGEGAAIAVLDMDEPGAKETAALIEKAGRRSLAWTVDISLLSQVQEAVNKILDLWGSIDIVVNNAGITRDALLIRMSEEDWDSVLAVNLKGAFNLSRATARSMMKQRSGCIVNVASIIGLMGNAGQANYAASKGGLIALTKSLAKEMAPRGIRVNAVAPGFIATEMTDKIPPQIKEEMVKAIPLSRMGTPEDVAGVVVFLASPSASYITGQVLIIDGGMYI
ncbi:MAG: 3-oxoacyl-[acyl-carrier-protein] reductase [Candidatus Euphemobacter frigidus]|nr:3-oxoacyl-[acyl-carrier-protein] reductase [Candidatus Euphemobacter frigidus]MDP8275107.1 3-oxoacyl-[acyl-carrier-protein] reductase [Candidatus Euphemobacter frigidus]